MNSSERRQANRFKGRLPVELENGSGITRDFSTSGIYFETDQSFSTRDSVELALCLEHLHLEHLFYLKCRGEVVRVEQGREKTGVAVTINSYGFEWHAK